MKFLFIFFSFIFANSFCLAQKHKSDYIKKYDTSINLRLGLINEVNKLEITNSQNIHYKLSPNESFKLKLTGQYDFLSVSYTYTPNFIPGNNDDALKGETSTANFGLNLYSNRFFGRIKLNKTTGYYVENTTDIHPEYTNKFIIFDNLEIKETLFELGYNTNKFFSYRAYTLFNEKQKVSAGSFIPQIFYSSNQYQNFTENTYDNKINRLWALTGSYHHTFVIKNNFFITTGLGFGGGRLAIETIDQNDNKNKTYINHIVQGRIIFQLGFSNDRIFYGFSTFSTKSTEIKKEFEDAFEDQDIVGQFYFGYRLGAPKIIKTSFNGIKNIFKRKNNEN